MSSFDGVKPRGYLHFNQYDQVINAAIEGHGVALGRLPLVQPMLNDGRLVAKSDVQPLTTDSSYWLVKTEETARQEVEIFASWIVEEVQAGVRSSPCKS
jgi:DNA-binding transcriptional LysR family regulator